MVAGWPLWWAFGVARGPAPALAVPLAWQLRRRGSVRVPADFWIWALIEHFLPFDEGPSRWWGHTPSWWRRRARPNLQRARR